MYRYPSTHWKKIPALRLVQRAYAMADTRLSSQSLSPWRKNKQKSDRIDTKDAFCFPPITKISYCNIVLCSWEPFKCSTYSRLFPKISRQKPWFLFFSYYYILRLADYPTGPQTTGGKTTHPELLTLRAIFIMIFSLLFCSATSLYWWPFKELPV